MAEVSFRGGAVIGLFSATWPFARLSVDEQRLRLSGIIQTLEFKPDEIVALQASSPLLPLCSQLRIVHNRQDSPEKVIFLCMGRGQPLLDKIVGSGFHPAGQPHLRAPGFVLRWPAVIALLAIWNALALLSNGHSIAMFLDFLFVFCLTTALPLSPGLRRCVLREGHHIGEILHCLRFIQCLSGGFTLVMIIGFLVRTW